MRVKTIVLGTDGSATAERAERVAVALANAWRARLLAVHGGGASERGAEGLRRVSESARAAGVKLSVEHTPTMPADAILEAASTTDADLIVLGRRGLSRARRMLLGSVSQKVAYGAPCDVLVIHRMRAVRRETPYRRILVATDGSATADRAARKGYEIAAKLSCGLTVLFVGHKRTGEIVLADTHRAICDDDAHKEKLDVRFRNLGGEAAQKIIQTAEAERIELIVVGNKGLGGTARITAGSVPMKVLDGAGCDVWVARTTTQSLTELAPGEGGIVRSDGRKVAVYRDENGAVHAFSAKCTHLGCHVAWNAGEKTWDCPCHGSRFGPTGEVVNGPADRPLARTDL